GKEEPAHVAERAAREPHADAVDDAVAGDDEAGGDGGGRRTRIGNAGPAREEGEDADAGGDREDAAPAERRELLAGEDQGPHRDQQRRYAARDRVDARKVTPLIGQ